MGPTYWVTEDGEWNMGMNMKIERSGKKLQKRELFNEVNPSLLTMDYCDQLEQQNIKNKTDIIYGDKLDTPKNLKIGIMNPFVLAQVFLKNRKKIQDVGSRDTLLEAISLYNDNTIASTKDLYNPAISPLFKPLDSKKILARYSEMGMTKPLGGNSIHLMKTNASIIASGPLNDSKRETGASGALNPEAPGDKELNKMGAPEPQSGTVPCPPLQRTSNNRGDIIGDVIQGACLDCYFMAALFSWAWTNPVYFPPALTKNAEGNFSISFYTYTYPTWTKKTIPVNPTLPLNQSSHLVFAQQTPDKNELWPAFFEKAYGVFLPTVLTVNIPDLTITGSRAYPPTHDPDTGQFPVGDPLLALTHLTKLLFTSRSDNNSAGKPSVFIAANVKNNPAAWGTTGFQVLENLNNPGNLTTKYPAVAWTFTSPPGNCSQYYGNAAIVPSHSYSVLGRYTSNNSKFVILRNPWGNHIDTSDTGLAPFGNSLASGVWTPDTSGLTINLGNNSNGIFGLETSVFEKCFDGFGWAQFSVVTP